MGYVQDLRKKGLTDAQIAKGMEMSVRNMRARYSLAKSEVRKEDRAFAIRLKNKGYSTTAAGQRMGINESSVRSLLSDDAHARSERAFETANMLERAIDKKKYVDIGAGVERHIGVNRTKLQTSVAQLQEKGYKVHYIQTEQMGTGKKTTVMVLTKGDVPWKEVYDNRHKIGLPTEWSEDKGGSYQHLEPINSVDRKRIYVRYGDEGGSDRDGVVELRAGVEDISLGKNRYAQIRIGVDGETYMKGMAINTNDIPPGYDMVYNTNKPRGTPDSKIFKPMSSDPDNPFGATVKQRHYTDSKGQDQLSALNIVYEEGDWGKWSKSISSQMLSKQSEGLAKRQLQIAYDAKKREFDEINALTNPLVKKRLLDAFADDVDSAAGYMKAAAMPRQASHVILPTDIKETEIYAPNYRNGENVVLIRYPHGGTFEIPELRVNNKHKGSKDLLGKAVDAVGINPRVAERLSGADFDGDTVLVIPNPRGEIKTTSPLEGLKDFDPKTSYPKIQGMKVMTKKGTQKQMGDISNLITDMTIKNANTDEIARAVRHSMVVIDAEKHTLNYTKSFTDNGIAQLKAKYQGGPAKGASTIISRARSEMRVPARKATVKVDPETGRKIYTPTGETYTDKAGRTHYKLTTTTPMAETTDARTLSSGTMMEEIYANHANKLKAMANETRKVSVAVKPPPKNQSAAKTYAREVASLEASLNTALKNAPIERRAQLVANVAVSKRVAANPDMDNKELKKVRGQELTVARARTGASKQDIQINDREWEAIQAGAISSNKLSQILSNTNLDRVKELATPRQTRTATSSQTQQILRLLAAGYTQADIADRLGISTSTVNSVAN